MAGDWIKMETSLPDKPEVWRIATILSIDPDAVIGKLLRVWAWFDTHTEDGNAIGVTYSLIDRISGVIGFGEAMTLCGWLDQNDIILSLPKFSRHNGKTAKNRALTNERVAKSRAKQRDCNEESNAANVTKTVTREEKRRSKPPKSPAMPDGFAEFWSAYPKKVDKIQAGKAWKKLNPDDKTRSALMAGLERIKRSDQWMKDGGQYIPNPTTWLNNHRWDDEPVSYNGANGSHYQTSELFRGAL